MKREEILEEAKEIITKNRTNQYGSPEDNFTMIATYWTVYLQQKITPKDVAMMMSLLKIARMKTGKFHKDNYADAIGYLACGYEVATKECSSNFKNNS